MANGQQQGLLGAVRISAPEGFGNFFLAPRIGELAAAHPRLAIEMITIQQIVALSRREADVAVTMTLPQAATSFTSISRTIVCLFMDLIPISNPHRPFFLETTLAIICSLAMSMISFLPERSITSPRSSLFCARDCRTAVYMRN
jgi:DNA-binding transcriptional LysR family regulator